MNYKKSYLLENLIYQVQGYGKQERTFNLGLRYETLEFLLGLSGVPPAGNLLEIGCGDGWGTVYLAQMNYHIVAIDSSKDAVEMARMRIRDMKIDNVEICNIDATQMIGLKREGFDVIIDSCCLHCILDLEERDSFLSEAYRVLKWGGSFLGRSISQPYTEITFPYREHVRIEGERVFRRFPGISDFIPFRIVRTEDEIVKEFSGAGWKISWKENKVIIPGFGSHHFSYHAKKT